MKFFTKAALVLGVVAALAAGIVALAFVPAVQKWALMRALARAPGEAEVEAVSAGMHAAVVRHLVFRQNGAVIRVPAARIEYSAWAALTGGAFRVESLAARGLVVDLRHQAPATAAPSAPAAFAGVLGALALPAGLRLGSADLELEILLPSPAAPEGRRLRLSVKGGGLEAGREAAFDYLAQFTDPAEGAVVPAAQATGRATLQSAKDGSVDALSARIEVSAEGDRLPRGESLVLVASVQRDAARRETIALSLARRGPTGAETQLLAATAGLNPETGALAGTWSLTLDRARLAAVLPAEATPEFDVAGEGRFALNPQAGAAELSGEIRGTLAQLERVSPALAAVGALGFHLAFAVAGDAGKVRLDQVHAQVSTARGTRLLAVDTLQGVTFDRTTGRFALADPATELATLELDDLPVAWLAPLAGDPRLTGGGLSGGFRVQATPTGDLLRVRTSRPLTLADVTLSKGTRPLLEHATIAVGAEIAYSATRTEAAIGSWSLTTAAGDRLAGKARMTVVPTPVLGADFQFSVAGNLPALLKPFSPVDPGTITVNGALEGSLAGDLLNLRSANLVVANAAGAVLLAPEMKQPLQVNLATRTAQVPDAKRPAGSLVVGNLPLAWAEAFVADAQLGGSVEGGAVDIFLTPEGHSVATRVPVTLKQVSLAWAGQPWIERLDALWDGTVTVAPARDVAPTFQATVRALEVRSETTELFSMKGAFESHGVPDRATLSGTARGSLAANLGALLAQPAATGWRHLSTGRVTADFEVRADRGWVGKVALAAQELAATGGRQVPDRATVALEGRFTPGQGGEFRMPATLASGSRKSDLLLVGMLAQRGKTLVFSGKASGTRIFVEDFQALAGLVPTQDAPPAAPRAPAATPGTARDERPVWAGVEGAFDLDLKSLVQNPANPITNLKARASIARDRVTLEHFEGTVAGSRVTASAALRFESAAANAYGIEGRFHVPRFDVAAFFRATDAQSPPSLESIVTADGTFSGRGRNLADLAGRVQGRVEATGGQGVFRGLAGTTGKVSAGASLIGAFFGGQRVQNTTQAVAELANELKELHFDKLTLKLARGDDLKLNIELLELLSPTIRLTGQGAIDMQPEIPLVQQPQRLELRLGFKAALGERMVQRQMTDGTTDDLGYARFRVPIVLTGNLLSPDSKQFWDAVTRSIGEMGVRSLLPGG